MKHMVRRFTSLHEGVRTSGDFLDGRFLVSFGQFQHAIETVGSGHDEFGEYVLIEDQEINLGVGCQLVVQVEYDEDDVRFGQEPGCCVTFREVDSRVLEAIRQAGVDPAKVNVIVQPRFSASVSFNAAGVCDGGGGSVCTRSVSRN